MTDAGPNAARWRLTMPSGEEARPRSGRPSQDSARTHGVGPLLPQVPLGGGWISGTRNCADQASAPGSWSGHRSASSLPSSGRVRGRSARSRLAAAASAAGSTPAVLRPKNPRWRRSSIGCSSGRQAR